MEPAENRDNGGRRSGMDRRRYSYTSHIPERRSDEDRRSGEDRRDGTGERREYERRAIHAI
ncbi:MAG: hypothetical protein JW932_10160 [Deltaproteobacteria bacterium]|nr:hypothetical protein [Deltaproteobacteria bacterium]